MRPPQTLLLVCHSSATVLRLPFSGLCLLLPRTLFRQLQMATQTDHSLASRLLALNMYEIHFHMNSELTLESLEHEKRTQIQQMELNDLVMKLKKVEEKGGLSVGETIFHQVSMVGGAECEACGGMYWEVHPRVGQGMWSRCTARGARLVSSGHASQRPSLVTHINPSAPTRQRLLEGTRQRLWGNRRRWEGHAGGRCGRSFSKSHKHCAGPLLCAAALAATCAGNGRAAAATTRSGCVAAIGIPVPKGDVQFPRSFSLWYCSAFFFLVFSVHKDKAKRSNCTQLDKASVNKGTTRSRSPTLETLGIKRVGGVQSLCPALRLKTRAEPSLGWWGICWCVRRG